MTPASLVVALAALGHPHGTHADAVRARITANVILREAHRQDIDPMLLAAVAARESTFRENVIGAAGERGLFQLIPDGAALTGFEHLSPRAVALTPINAFLAAHYLATLRERCARKGITDPAAWLTAFNGGGCRAGRYGRAVVAAAARARRAVAKAEGIAIASSERWPRVGLGTAPSRAREIARR